MRKMLRENITKSIVEWHNCMCDSEPVESLEQLRDGDNFYKLAVMISSPAEIAESVQAKYAFVEGCINEFYRTECHVLVNFENCQKGSVFELAKVAILLLSAVVHLNLTEGTSVVPLVELDPGIQEDIKDCISAVLLKGDSASITLSSDFATVLSVKESSPDNMVGVTPRKRALISPAMETPQRRPVPQRGRRKRGRPPASHYAEESATDSPIKMLLDSPQILNQVSMRKLEKKVFTLESDVKNFQSMAFEFESKNDTLQNDNNIKEKEIKRLSVLVTELRKVCPASTPPTRSRRNSSPSAKLSQCQNCVHHKDNIEELRADNDKLIEELEEKGEKLNTMELCNQDIVQRNTELEQKVVQLEGMVKRFEENMAEMNQSMTVSQHIADVHKAKYEESKREIDRAQASPCKFCAKSPSGETMDVVPEKVIVELKMTLEDKERQLKDSDEVIKEMREKFENMTVEKGEAVNETARVLNHKDDLLKKLEHITQQLESTETQCANYEKDIKMLRSELKTLYTKYDKLNLGTKTTDQKVKTLQSQVKQLNLDKQTLQNKKTELSNSNSTLSKDAEENKRLISSLESSIERLESTISEQSEKIQTLENELRSIEQNKGSEVSIGAEEIIEIDDEPNEDENLVLEVKETNTEKEELNARINEISSDLANQVNVNTDMKNIAMHQEEQISKLTENLAKSESELSSLRKGYCKQLDDLRNECEDIKSEKNSLISQNEELMSKIESLLSEQSENDLRIRELEKMNDELMQTNENLMRENSSYVIDANSNQGVITNLKRQMETLREQLEAEKSVQMNCKEEIRSIYQQMDEQKNAHKGFVEDLERSKAELSKQMKDLAERSAECEEKLVVSEDQLQQMISDAELNRRLRDDEKTSYNNKSLQWEEEKQKLLEANESLLAEKTELLNKISETNGKASTHETELLKLKSHFDDCDQKLKSSLSKKECLIEEMSQKMEQHSSEVKALKEQVVTLQVEREEMNKRHESLQEEKERNCEMVIINCNNEINKLKSSRGRVETLNTSLQSMLKDKELSLSQTMSDLENLQRELLQINRVKDSLEKDKSSLESEYSSLQSQMVHLKSRAESSNQETEQATSTLSELQRKREVLQTENARLQDLVKQLKANVSTMEGEKDRLFEKCEDLERNLRSLNKSKELSEKDYYRCVQEKERTIESLQKSVSEQQQLLKSSLPAQKNDTTDNSSLLSELKYLRQSFETEQQRSSDLQEKYGEVNDTNEQLYAENEKLKEIKMELNIELLSLRKKYSKTKELAIALELNSKSESKRHEEKREKLWEQLQLSKSSNVELHDELEQMKMSLEPLKEEISNLDSTNRRMLQENISLSAQLNFADSELRKLNRHVSTKDELNRRQTLSSSHPEFRGSVLSLKSEKSFQDFRRDISRNRVSSRASVEPSQEKSVIPRITYPEPLNGNLNGSFTGEGFSNRSLLNGHFPIEDEDEFLNHRRIQEAMSPSDLNSCFFSPLVTPSRRINELERRNTLCPPHMKSSYPAEMLARVPRKISDDGIAIERRSSMSGSVSSNKAGSSSNRAGSSSNRAGSSSKRKRNNSIHSEKETKKSQNGRIPTRLIREAENVRKGNPFRSPSSFRIPKIQAKTPTSLKKLMASKFAKNREKEGSFKGFFKL